MRLASSSKLGTVLAAAEQERATVTGMDSRVRIVTDRLDSLERVGLWELWLREAAAASPSESAAVCVLCISHCYRYLVSLDWATGGVVTVRESSPQWWIVMSTTACRS